MKQCFITLYILFHPLNYVVMRQMNQLIPVILLVAIAIVGVMFIMGASANPAGKVTELAKNSASVKMPLMVDGKQDVFLKATQYGTYSPNYLKVKKGIPVRIHYSADEDVGCGREVIFPEFKQRKLAPSTGEVLIEFTPTKAGTFPFHCPMQMFRGTIEVVE